MKVLVTGAGGMLAKDLLPCLLERGYDAIGLPHQDLDITELESVRAAVADSEPQLLVNCAAYTKVDEAEREQYRALMVNGLGVHNLCLVCQERSIPLLHFSTDYIFDGTKAGPYTIYDDPNPINAYGRSKLVGERYVLWLLRRFYLVRSSWLFGLHGANFVETMLELGQSRKHIAVVDDQRGCPTWTHHLAQAVVALIETGRYGVYHITNSEPTTWFDFATEIFRISNVDVEVSPTSSDRLQRPAKRPRNSVLDPFPLPQVLGREMPPWREALQEYLERKGAATKAGAKGP